MRELMDRAARDGVAVVRARLPEGMLGCYLPGEARIYLALGLTPIEQRSVLAHELGHVHYGHGFCSPDGSAAARSEERRADVFAARLLIDPDDYARAEGWITSADELAEDLGVTPDLLCAYREHCLHRVSGGVRVLTRIPR